MTTIEFKTGEVRTFPNAGVQKKDDGQVIAVYDRKSLRILVEFPSHQIASWRTEE